MVKKNMVVLIAVLAVLIALGWYLYQTYFVTTYPVIKAAPAFEYTNVDGNQVSLESTNGKARLVYFFYSNCPDVCLPSTYILSKIQGHLKEAGGFGEDTALMSITFDPDFDTIERLKEVAASSAVQADLSGWYFLRGDQQDVMDTAEAYNIPVMKLEDGTYAHYNLFILIDPDGNIRNYYNAGDIELDPADVAKDMVRLSK